MRLAIPPWLLDLISSITYRQYRTIQIILIALGALSIYFDSKISAIYFLLLSYDPLFGIVVVWKLNKIAIYSMAVYGMFCVFTERRAKEIKCLSLTQNGNKKVIRLFF
jgi:hypothetical protein